MEMMWLWVILILCAVGLVFQTIFAIMVIHHVISEGHCDDFFEALSEWHPK